MQLIWPRTTGRPQTSDRFTSLFSIHAQSFLSFPVQRDICIPGTQDVLPPHPTKTVRCEQNTQHQLYKLELS